MVYDWMGRRTSKVVSNWTGSAWAVSEERYVYDNWNLIAILDGNMNLLYSFTWGLDASGTMQGAGGVGGLISMTVHSGPNAATYFYAYGGNYNVVALVNAANGSIAAQYDYGAFGEMIRATGPLAKINPFLFSTKFYDWETGLYYYGYRYYNPSTGRWLSTDPNEKAGGVNLYAYLANDPINDTDYLGQSGVKTTFKNLITDSITGSAEAIFDFLQDHPPKAWEISIMNELLPPLKGKAASFFDSKTKTMGWGDYIFNWFFELGNAPFDFVEGDKTTSDLKGHEGVNEARALAKTRCADGNLETQKTWVYGVDQFYSSISSVDSVAIALGSYSVAVKSSRDCCTLEFTVENDATWESATRFRKAAKPGGLHQPTISNRARNGSGIQLGGNMHSTWKWKETCE